MKKLASFYLHSTVYCDFFRNFPLKKHQYLPRYWWKIKNADHFFKSGKNSETFFHKMASQKEKFFSCYFILRADLTHLRINSPWASRRNPEIFNSDQGCQFTSDEFIKELQNNGIQISMVGRGRCNNAKMEHFWCVEM